MKIKKFFDLEIKKELCELLELFVYHKEAGSFFCLFFLRIFSKRLLRT